MGFRRQQKPVQPRAIIDSNGMATSERQIAVAPLSLVVVQLLGNSIAANPSSDASP
jgi:hypothetical protein